MGAALLTETMERCPEIGFESYDRFFPNQDTMPSGGFGNLIALPLQRTLRENGNSVFLDKHFEPYADQWAYLASIRRMLPSEISAIGFHLGVPRHWEGGGRQRYYRSRFHGRAKVSCSCSGSLRVIPTARPTCAR